MFKRISKLLVILLLVPFVFVGCGRKVKKTNENTNFNGNTDFKIEASASSSSIDLSITNVKKPSGYKNGKKLSVTMLKPYEYYKGEGDMGVLCLENKYSTGENVGTYVVGSPSTISIDRFEADSGYDRLYNKFVLTYGGEFVAGPFLVSDIASQRTFDEKIVAATKKGIIGQINDCTKDLGCGWTEYNIKLNNIIWPNEKLENGQIVPTTTPHDDSNSISFVSNGKTYYFKKDAIDEIDNNMLFCKENDIKAVLIIYNDNHGDNFDQESIPYFLSYPSTYSYTKKSICALDTSNEIGMGYFVACMEFLADRYSREDGEFGYVHRFVIGNEIDISWDWNPVLNYDTTSPLSLKDYVEEYLRTLRIAEQATKKYYKNNMVLVSTCHYWGGVRVDKAAYASKDIYDYLNEKVTYEGNFNWGMASHPYPAEIGEHDYLNKETSPKLQSEITFDYNTATCYTWTNLEIIDDYLKQDSLKFNGTQRRVYLTEGGVSSGGGSLDSMRKIQAAGIAFAYFKSVNLDCIDAFIYYKLVDSPAEGAYFGVMDDAHNPKYSYEMFKYIDTQYAFDVANEYLGSIVIWKGDICYNTSRNNISSYLDVMKVVNSNYHWEVKFSEEKVKVRNVSTHPNI